MILQYRLVRMGGSEEAALVVNKTGGLSLSQVVPIKSF